MAGIGAVHKDYRVRMLERHATFRVIDPFRHQRCHTGRELVAACGRAVVSRGRGLPLGRRCGLCVHSSDSKMNKTRHTSNNQLFPHNHLL